MTRATDRVVLLLAVAAAAFGLWGRSVGWNHSIYDLHAFRQSQTALTAYWIARGGPVVRYATPIFGPPWPAPFEFPLFQWIAADVSRWLSTDLDRTGRCVSIAFSLLILPALYRALAIFDIRPRHRYLFLALLLASPLYIFWSRTFMLESTALCLSVWYAVFVYDASIAATPARLTACTLMAGLTGIVAAMVKATALFPFLVVSVLLVARASMRGRRTLLPSVLLMCAVCVPPAVAAIGWQVFADRVKMENPVAASLVSGSVVDHNYGSIRQRLQFRSWYVVPASTIAGRTRHTVIGSATVFLLALAAAALRRRRCIEAGICLVLFMVPIAVFMNLYLAHVYYAYENGIFLIVAVGLGIVTLLELGGARAWIGAGLFGAAIAFMMSNYTTGYYRDQASTTYVNPPLGAALQHVTRRDDVLLIYGLAFSSELPYASERRAIMDWENRGLADPVMQRSLAGLGGLRIGAMVACGDARSLPIIEANARMLRFTSDPALGQPACTVYLPDER